MITDKPFNADSSLRICAMAYSSQCYRGKSKVW